MHYLLPPAARQRPPLQPPRLPRIVVGVGVVVAAADVAVVAAVVGDGGELPAPGGAVLIAGDGGAPRAAGAGQRPPRPPSQPLLRPRPPSGWRPAARAGAGSRATGARLDDATLGADAVGGGAAGAAGARPGEDGGGEGFVVGGVGAAGVAALDGELDRRPLLVDGRRRRPLPRPC